MEPGNNAPNGLSIGNSRLRLGKWELTTATPMLLVILLLLALCAFFYISMQYGMEENTAAHRRQEHAIIENALRIEKLTRAVMFLSLPPEVRYRNGDFEVLQRELFHLSPRKAEPIPY